MAKRNPPGGTKTRGLGLVQDLGELGEGEIAVLGDDLPPDGEDGAGEEITAPQDGSEDQFQDPGPHYASESEFAATPEEHKEAGRNKKGGRPSNPIPTGPDQLIHVPTPKFSSFKWDSVNPNQRTRALWTWWNALHPSQKDQLQAYVYRDWPVLKLAPGQEVKEVGANPSIDKVSGSEPIQDDVDFLRRWGVGVYRLRLNKVTRDGSSGTITTAYIGGLGNDMKSSPPADKRISDLQQLDMTHPENAGYIAFLRMHGKLEDGNREEEMATVTAVSEMTGIVKDLIKDKNSQATEGQVASTKAMEVVAEGAKAGIKIVQDANEYAARQRETADAERTRREGVAHAAQTPGAAVQVADPFDQAIKIVNLLNQSKSNDQLLERFMEMSNKQLERMEVMMKESLNRPQLQPTPIVDRIKDLKDLREISQDLFGNNGREDSVADGVADAAGDMAPKWLRPFIPVLVPVLTGLAQGFMSRGPVPTPGQPMAPPVQYPPQALPFPPQPVQFPNQPPIPAPIPTQATNPPGMDPQVAALLGMIRVPFLTQIQDPSLTGTDFAGWFVDGFGMPTHNQIISLGPEAIFQAICAYPPIANELAAMRMPEKRVRDFVNEFCDPKWDDGGVDGKTTPPATTPTTPPATTPTTPPATTPPAPVA